ncbi:MAG: hypothetical protein H6733_00080 [Alphaproteobacteria bacterium]|nr:hypothetical protein [Alphaproteobacteria bacterium]
MPRTPAALTLCLVLGCADGTAPTTTDGSPGTITGSFDGLPFDHLGAAWRLGSPDDPTNTLVVVLLDHDVACAELADPGWDARVPDGSQALEIKVIGHAPGTYPLATTRTAGPGESDVNYTLTSTTGTPAETSADTGSVTLTATDAGAAAGSFELVFPTGDALSGTFDAAPCDGGSEP